MSHGRYQDPKKPNPGRPTPPPPVPPKPPAQQKPPIQQVPPTVPQKPAVPKPPAQQKLPTQPNPPAKRTLPSGSGPTPVISPPKQRPADQAPTAGQDEYALATPDEYAIRGEPVVARAPVLTPRIREPVVTEKPQPKPPVLTFWSGIFSFPFYLQSLGAWMLVAMGLTIGALGIVLCIWCLDQGQTIAFRCFVMPVLMIIAFTCSYASAVCQTITQVTSEGYDKVEDWPRGDWREWAWTMIYPLSSFSLAALVGWGVHVSFSQPMLTPILTRAFETSIAAQASGADVELPFLARVLLWLPGLTAAFLIYPILLLSALENGSAVGFLSPPVLKSLRLVWWGWGIFFVETGVMFAAWCALVIVSYPEAPWLTAALSAPVLAVIAMIYARLVGRLAWYIDYRLNLRQTDDEDAED